MGGYFSGRRGDGNTTGSSLAFDVRHLHREGCLRPGFGYSWTWHTTHNGQRHERGAISFLVRGPQQAEQMEPQRAESLELIYKVRQGGEGSEWKTVRERVLLEWTLCHYGGSRPWFWCPRCQRRCAVLYCPSGRFLCRLCHRLPYDTQNEKPADRLLTKAWNIRKSLGQKDGGIMDFFPPKPKGMHWSTYWKLREKGEEAEHRQWIIIGAYMERREEASKRRFAKWEKGNERREEQNRRVLEKAKAMREKQHGRSSASSE